MPLAFILLRCIGKAIVKNAVKGVVNAFSFGVGGDILLDAWDHWQQASKEEQRAGDVAALAAAPPVEVAAAAVKIAQEEGGQLSDADKETLTEYLRQVPAMIHRSQRRPADPEGKTLLPGAMFQKPEDLYPMLPPRPSRFKPGDHIGDWQLVEMLGRGGFGEVWKAQNPFRPSARPVALKFCLDGAAAKALRNEVRLLDRVESQGRHVGIVPLLRTHLNADPPYLEYDYVPGGDLGGLIRDKRLTGGRLSPHQAGRIIQRLAEIVGFTHRLNPPIVHRDLKPANVLVQMQPDGKVNLRIADFGIGGLALQHARDISRPQPRVEIMTTADLGACTPLYASPQQMRNEAPDPRDDVYALGVIWHQLLTGDMTKSRPGGDAWKKRLTDLGMTPSLLSLLAASFEDEREDRPADGAALAQELERLIDQLPPRGAKTFTNSIDMHFTLIQAGTFLMGSPQSEGGRKANEGPQHAVAISRSFYLGIVPVTQRQYEAVMGCNPSLFAGNPDHPVERVCWDDAIEFCTRLSALAAEKKSGRAYRLPTEAEWEFACRAGIATPFHFGASASSKTANFDGNYPYGEAAKGPYLQRTTKVGSYPRNGWGLYDMHGNVREWCADWFAENYYRKKLGNDPQGPPAGEFRVQRGGSWGSKGANCRAAYREGGSPANRNNAGFGFRVACSIVTPQG